VAVPSVSSLHVEEVVRVRTGILIITWNYPPRRGGIECLMGDLVRVLKQKHSVFVITTHAPNQGGQEEGIHRASWSGLIPFAFYALCRGMKLLKRNRDIRLIFGGSVVVTPLVLILARLFRRKAIVQAHGLDLVFPSSLYQLLCVPWLKFCDRIIANSAYTASLAVKRNVPADLISVIPPGIDPDALRSSPELNKNTLGLAEGPKILFVGRLAKRKGVKEFIEKSFVKIIQEIPNARFMVVGDNPHESLTHREDVLGQIRAVVRELKLQSHVHLLGALSDDDVVRLYHASDVVVLPALATIDDVEGFGITLLEAAAAGKPTVATRMGGISDAVENGKSGILVEPDDYCGLARAIVSLLQNREKSLAMGEFGQRRVRDQFAWSKIGARYEAVFDAPPGISR
jgi:phosphatidyl-myo-inositol dimannoside synthase